jgi:hypothetical protein
LYGWVALCWQLPLENKERDMGDGGKGSKQRPTDKQKFDDGWDRIFGKKKPAEQPAKKDPK